MSCEKVYLREIPVGSANSNVQDEIEWLIKGSILPPCLRPWIIGCGTVYGRACKASERPQICVILEIEGKDLLERISRGLSSMQPALIRVNVLENGEHTCSLPSTHINK